MTLPNNHDQPAAHLAADAGVDTHAFRVPADPIAAYFDLMRTLDALRPPDREPRTREPIDRSGYVYKL